MAELKFPDFAGEDGATLAGTVITLAGSAVTNHRTFANAASDANIDFDDGDTLAVDVIDTGGNTATWTATYASGAGTLTRVSLEAAQGTLSTSAGAITVYASVPGNWFKEMEPNRLPISATTAVTTSDVTGAAGTQYHLDISGITTASKNFTLPVPAAAGERIKVTLDAGDDDYELIIKGVATVTINGGSAATEWSRIFITGESVSFVSTSTTNWNVEVDGRIPCFALVTFSAATTMATSGTWYDLTNLQVSPATDQIGNLLSGTTTLNIRRTGSYKADAQMQLTVEGSNSAEESLRLGWGTTSGSPSQLGVKMWNSTSVNQTLGVPFNFSTSYASGDAVYIMMRHTHSDSRNTLTGASSNFWYIRELI